MDEQRMFGHWTLTVSGRGDRVRLLIDGTDSVDGIYFPPTQPFVLQADGVVWRMGGERLPRGSEEWVPLKPVAASTWDPQLGLTRRFRWAYDWSAGAAPGAMALVIRHRLLVDCWSHDPDLAAVPTPDPPGFTVPKKIGR